MSRLASRIKEMTTHTRTNKHTQVGTIIKRKKKNITSDNNNKQRKVGNTPTLQHSTFFSEYLVSKRDRGRAGGFGGRGIGVLVSSLRRRGVVAATRPMTSTSSTPRLLTNRDPRASRWTSSGRSSESFSKPWIETTFSTRCWLKSKS